MVPRSLDAVLSPVTHQEFFSAYWGKRHHYIPGESQKFGGLLSWQELNRVLRQHRLGHPRLRLAKEGETISPSSFLSQQRARRGNQIPRLQSVELQKHLREGATLIIDAIDEMSEPVARLAENLEGILRERVQVNAYAAWRPSPGFGLHWDDHDVFVLQVAGKKQWEIYGFSRKYPLYRDAVPNDDSPEEPVWTGELSAGDFLYIPRGWWHEAVATGEPTLHLTFGINNRNGIDFLGWLQDKMREREIFRKDLPRHASEEAQKAHLKQLREEFFDFWRANPTLIDQYGVPPFFVPGSMLAPTPVQG